VRPRTLLPSIVGTACQKLISTTVNALKYWKAGRPLLASVRFIADPSEVSYCYNPHCDMYHEIGT
jgi:hypothetical protein